MAEQLKPPPAVPVSHVGTRLIQESGIQEPAFRNALLLIQLPLMCLGKQTMIAQILWLLNPLGKPGKAPGSWLQITLPPAIAAIQEVNQRMVDFLSLCIPAFQIKMSLLKKIHEARNKTKTCFSNSTTSGQQLPSAVFPAMSTKKTWQFSSRKTLKPDEGNSEQMFIS